MKTTSVLFTIVLFFVTINGTAQSTYLRDYNGRVITPEPYNDVRGTPYLSDSWNKGYIKLSNGITYKDVDLKFNQLKGELLYKQQGKDEIMTFADPVEEFLISEIGDDSVNNKLFIKDKESNGLNGSTYYEILYNGSTKLLKKTYKYISEQNQYNSATKTKLIQEKITYYLSPSSEDVFEFKKDKKSLEALMGEKKTVVEKFINNNKINLKTEAGLIKIVTFYNTLL